MNANELAIKFIQRHGYEFAKHILGDFFGSMTHVTNDGRTFLNCNHPDLDIDIKKQLNSMVLVCDVKRLAESWELVESYGGLDGAKGEFFEIIHSGQYSKTCPAVLKQAIADVESVSSKRFQLMTSAPPLQNMTPQTTSQTFAIILARVRLLRIWSQNIMDKFNQQQIKYAYNGKPQQWQWGFRAGYESRQAELDQQKLLTLDSELHLDAAKEEIERLRGMVDKALNLINNWWHPNVDQKLFIEDVSKALKGHDQYTEHRTKAEEQINKGARLTKHQIDL